MGIFIWFELKKIINVKCNNFFFFALILRNSCESLLIYVLTARGDEVKRLRCVCIHMSICMYVCIVRDVKGESA